MPDGIVYFRGPECVSVKANLNKDSKIWSIILINDPF